MRNEVEKFCDDIKVEYFLYLYNKGERLLFPKCCKLSADLITSFLKLVCSDKFQYICTTNRRCYNHAWTYYDDRYEEFIIDFTNLQYTNEHAKRMQDREISIEEFKYIVSKEKVVFDPDETYMYSISNLMSPKEQKCFGILDKFEGELSKKCFMEYLERSYDMVFDKTVYY